MPIAVNNGGGSMAQFNCPELGGSGQWMSGGMTMVGDLFNNGLRNTVDTLCCELANSLASIQVFPVIPAGTPGSAQWWPMHLGVPFSSGAQNNTRYAVFQGCLAVELEGVVTLYDTLNHHIGGVSQQQGVIPLYVLAASTGLLLLVVCLLSPSRVWVCLLRQILQQHRLPYLINKQQYRYKISLLTWVMHSNYWRNLPACAMQERLTRMILRQKKLIF